MFTLLCPGCGRRNEVPVKYAGKRIKCPGCAGPLDVPAGAPNGASPQAGRTPRRQPTGRPAPPPPAHQPAPSAAIGYAPAHAAPGTSRQRRTPRSRRQKSNGAHVAIVAIVVALLLIGGLIALVVVAIDQGEKADDYMEYVQNKERETLKRKEERYQKFVDEYNRHLEAHQSSPSNYGGPGDTVEVAGLKASVSGKREKVPSLSHSSVYNEANDETTVLTAETPVDVRLGTRQIIVQLGYIHPGRTMESRRDVKGVILIGGDVDDLKDQSMTVKFDGQTMLLRNNGDRAGKVVFDLNKNEMRELAQSAQISVEFGRVSFAFANEHMRLLEQVRILE